MSKVSSFVAVHAFALLIFPVLWTPAYGQLDARVANLETRLAIAEGRLNVLQATKPSAHLDGSRSELVSVTDASDLKFWNPSAGRSHLVGGFTYSAQAGGLRVPQRGNYFVYAQMWNFQPGAVRHFLYASGRRLAVAGASDGQSQSTWAGGVFSLNAGDMLTVRLVSRGTVSRTIWPGGAHTYFGAFLVS